MLPMASEDTRTARRFSAFRYITVTPSIISNNI